MGSLSAMGDLRVGDVRTPPTGPGSVREADFVRGPAYDGVLSPAVPAPLMAPPSSAPFEMDSLSAMEDLRVGDVFRPSPT